MPVPIPLSEDHVHQNYLLAKELQYDLDLLKVRAQEAQQAFLNTPFTCKHFTAHPVPPAGTPSAFVPIKLVNVPVLSLVVVEQQLRSFWSQHGDVVAIAPHKYKGTTGQSLKNQILIDKASSAIK